jgi:hypothetical protein
VEGAAGAVRLLGMITPFASCANMYEVIDFQYFVMFSAGVYQHVHEESGLIPYTIPESSKTIFAGSSPWYGQQ